MRFRRLLAVLLLVTLSWPLAAGAPPALRGKGGAVASEDATATAAGLSLLRAGGNAVDAAVATALALAVTFPEAGNLGGGGFAVIKMGDTVAALDFREVAPAAATRNMYLDAAGEPIPDASLVGPLAAGVPGSPAGLWALHQRFGARPWQEVVEPARRLAAEGFVVDSSLTARLAAARELLARFPETAALWLPGNEPLAPGSRVVQPALARTLARYQADGPPAITHGELANEIEAASRRYGGILTAADLAAYHAEWRQPLLFSAFGWEWASMPLPSSGGIILAESSALLARWGWAEMPRFGADRAHLLAESYRRAYADRYRLGDPSTTEVELADLLTPEALASRAASLDRARATPSAQLMPAAAEPAEVMHTTHLSVVDGAGNVVALTATLNGLFGCGLYLPGLGFLNNEMDDFAAAPGRPNLFGLIQGEANAVRPGKRMLSSMSPTIVWRGAEVIAAGGRGGSRIPTNTHQVLLNVLVDGDPLQAAINRPRLHHQWLPDELQGESDTFAPETRLELERRGHKVIVTPVTAKVEAVRRLPDGTVEAACEPRGARGPGVVERLPGDG